MKFLKIWAAAAILCGVSAVSFMEGRQYESYYYNYEDLFKTHQELKDSCQKHYEAACLEADFIRYLIDHFDGDSICWNIGAEIENSYDEFFMDLDCGIFNTKYLTLKELDSYGWCY